jgi:hypothetical protein
MDSRLRCRIARPVVTGLPRRASENKIRTSRSCPGPSGVEPQPSMACRRVAVVSSPVLVPILRASNPVDLASISAGQGRCGQMGVLTQAFGQRDHFRAIRLRASLINPASSRTRSSTRSISGMSCAGGGTGALSRRRSGMSSKYSAVVPRTAASFCTRGTLTACPSPLRQSEIVFLLTPLSLARVRRSLPMSSMQAARRSGNWGAETSNGCDVYGRTRTTYSHLSVPTHTVRS